MAEDLDFGLNIVCEAPVVANRRNNVDATRHKKKNKYEKRRERSKRAKSREESVSTTGTGADAGASARRLTPRAAAITNDASPAVPLAVDTDSNTNTDALTSPSQHQREGHGDDIEQESKELESQKPASEPQRQTPSVPLENKGSPSAGTHLTRQTETTTAAGTPVPVPLVTKSHSRKHHRDLLLLDNDNNGDQEQQQLHANYMAEFHARPLEMDRRAGASGKYTQSKDSMHLFETNKMKQQLPLHPKLLLQCQTKFNMKQATLIQTNTWEQFHSNGQKNNLFVQSETGSGKTLAYLLPIVQSLVVGPNNNSDDSNNNTTPTLIQKDRASGGTVCLIICPTRELASQTLTFVETITRGTWLVAGCLSGGEKRKSEKSRIRKGISILVATPGRLLDHLTKTEALLISLKGKLKYLVLDESDRLLDMGLGGQVEQIVQRIRANQPGSGRNGITWRSLLVSATVSHKEEELAKTLMGGEQWVWARGGGEGRRDGEHHDQQLLDESTPRQLSQLHITVTAKLRLATLVAFLVQRVALGERTVVFMSTCDGVDYHDALFKAVDCILPSKNESEENQPGLFGATCPIFKLHGSVVHAERQAILLKFNSCKTALLLATDVAARGLNLSRVDWIVQYDPPCEVADYAHRAGRAARAGQAGHALLFLLPSERQFLEVLELKGVKKMDALSVAHTLNRASEICSEVTAECKAGFKNKGEAFSAEVQRRFEDTVMQDDAQTKASYKPPARMKGQPRPPEPCGVLLELARKAFFAYVRAYPTKEKIVRHIFSSRALHVGHIARSFALKEPPTSSMTKVAKSSNKEDDSSGKRSAVMAFQSLLDEAQAVVQIKRQRKSAPTAKSALIKSDGTVDTSKARMMLMERAAKLQQGGMSSF